MHNSETIYCSIDLEMTGFDPERDEILEVGFVLFRMTASGAVVFDRFTQVFKPKQEVHVKIRALTGISERETETAPDFTDFRDGISQKIAGSVIVGHSVMTDIRFLRANGVVVPEMWIDTLELAQWILPTHHSYNLENLIHFLDALHPNAHRALADAEATMRVLEALLRVFQGYPSETKLAVIDFLGKHAFFAWASLLDLDLGFKRLDNPVVKPVVVSDSVPQLLEVNEIITVTGSRQSKFEQIASIFSTSKEPILFLVARETDVLDYWKFCGFEGIFDNQVVFNETKFLDLLQSSDLSPEQVVFLLKIMIWKSLNWQTKTLHDLNVSFFGNQFIPLVTGVTSQKIAESSKVLCATYETYAEMLGSSLFGKRLIVCDDLTAVENFLIGTVSNRVSWGYINGVLKSIYNPETGFGDKTYSDVIAQALVDTDLFFAILATAVRKFVQADGYIVWEVLESVPFGFFRLKQAAAHFAEKLFSVAQKTGREDLVTTANNLQGFFEEASDRVKWIEYHEDRILLRNQILNVSNEKERLFHDDSDVSYINTLAFEEAFGFYKHRLGLSALKSRFFDSTKALNKKTKITYSRESLSDERLLEFVSNDRFPLLVVFDSLSRMKSFYDAHYEVIKGKAAVYAQLYAGGSNKILRNFSLKEKSVLLVTRDFLLKNSFKKIAPKSVVFTDFFAEGSRTPYELAVADSLTKDGFSYDYWSLRRLYDLELLLGMFGGKDLMALDLFTPEIEDDRFEELQRHLSHIGL